MNLEEMLKSAMQKDKITTPLFIVAQHPEVQTIRDFQEKKNAEFCARFDALHNEAKEAAKMLWGKIEDYCVQHGFMTQEEKDKNIALAIKDGVLYKE